jgi:hypothetical protein
MSITGFAIKFRAGELDVRTVSPTPRAAKVNALALYGNRTPTDGWSDAVIDRTWEVFAAVNECRLVEVVIIEADKVIKVNEAAQ